MREALRLRRRAAQPARTLHAEPNPPPTDHNPIAAAAQVLLGVFALGILPRAAHALARSSVNVELFLFSALVASLTAGWLPGTHASPGKVPKVITVLLMARILSCPRRDLVSGVPGRASTLHG